MSLDDINHPGDPFTDGDKWDQSPKRKTVSVGDMLRARAELYAPTDGSFGPLSTVWGWGSIGRELRKIADELERK